MSDEKLEYYFVQLERLFRSYERIFNRLIHREFANLN